jgi:hypothetical protein
VRDEEPAKISERDAMSQPARNLPRASLTSQFRKEQLDFAQQHGNMLFNDVPNKGRFD